MRQVYLAGRGLVSALGPDVAAALATMRRGAVRPGRITVGPGVQWPFHAIAEEVEALAAADWHERARRLIGRAVAEAGGDAIRHAPLFVASSSLNIGAIEQGYPLRPDCLVFAEWVAACLAWRGPVMWVSTACTSAVNALLAALRTVRNGAADDALVIGVELRNRYTSAGFGAMQLLDAERARPLGIDRGGLVLGEAVAALRVSTEPGRWRLCGGANVVDGRDPAGATEDAVVTMCQRACEDSAVPAEAIDLVKLQAAGSISNDATELAALQRVFAPMPPLVSLKALLGHTLGAAGAAEPGLLMACLESGTWPQTDYLFDPALHASLASTAPQACRFVLSNILGFGGGHAALVLEQCLEAQHG